MTRHHTWGWTVFRNTGTSMDPDLWEDVRFRCPCEGLWMREDTWVRVGRGWVGRSVVSLVAVVAVGVLGAAPASSVIGDPTVEDAYLFLANVEVGTAANGGRGCTGALVAPRWVLTSKACFTEAGSPPAAGPPSRASRAIVGRLDAAGGGGNPVQVTSLVPHPARDVVLAKLATPVASVAPVTLAASAATVAETVRVAGFGRTGTEWVPDKPHVGGFTVQSVTGGQVAVVGATAGATLCKGDAGGPATRLAGGQHQLLAITSTSWQGGCLGSGSETRTEGTLTRVDDLGGWILDSTIKPDTPRGMVELASGHWNRDGNVDLLAVEPGTGKLLMFPGTARDVVFDERVQMGRSGWDGMHDLAVGRFNADDFDDVVVAETSSGKLWLYPGTAGGELATRSQLGNAGWNAMTELTAGLFNHDAHGDLLAVDKDTKKMWLYPGTAAGGLGTRVAIGVAATAAPARTETTAAADAQASTVEDYAYPGAELIPAEHGLRVSRGDGHIMFVAARDFEEGQCEAGQIQVEQSFEEPPFGVWYCFRATGTQGYLAVEVPGTFAIRGGDKPLTATAHLPNGPNQTFPVPPNLYVPILPGDGSEPPRAILVELRLTA